MAHPPDGQRPFAEAQSLDELCQMVSGRGSFNLGDKTFTAAQVRRPVEEVIKAVRVKPAPSDADILEFLIWVPAGVPSVDGLRLRLAELLEVTQCLPGTGGAGGGKMRSGR